MILPFNPTSKFGNDAGQTASIMGWIYIDKWNEGAEIFSNYLDESNCITATLGNEADKEFTVNLCGTTATIKNQLEVGKWIYIGIYLQPSIGAPGDLFFEPILIYTGQFVDGEFIAKKNMAVEFTLELGGSSMTINTVPVLRDGTLTIGKDFAGKIDELMVWGTNRQSSFESDAVNEYQWNIGSWNNIFLNAYWKGDDPENIGKDSQSIFAIADFIRNYYSGYRGWKMRLAMIYPDGEKWKYNVLNKEENVDNLIRDAKELVKHFDGLDVDLEWSYSDSDWNTYNNIIRRLINEVMAEYPEKDFSCSLHEVSYAGFDKSLLPGVDYFTFQQYGPNIFPTFDRYKQYGDAWIEWGFGKDKIEMSYATLTMTGTSEEGYKDLFEKYGMNDDNFDPDLNTWTVGGTTYNFTGITQLRQKMQYIIDNDLCGTMYFDMGNDLRVDDYKSLIRAQNEMIASNVDTLVTSVTMKPSGVHSVLASKGAELFTAVQNGETLTVTLADGDMPATLAVYAVDGRAVMQQPLDGKVATVATGGMQRGVYLLRVTQGGENHTVKIAIK